MIPENVKDFVLEYDYFQTPFTISFHRKTSISSYQGLFFSLIAYGLILFIAINEGEKAFINPWPGINYYYETFEEKYSKKLDQYPILISHESLSSSDILKQNYISLKVLNNQVIINQNGLVETKSIELELIKCDNNHDELFNERKISEVEKKYKIHSDLLCIKELSNIFLFGTEREIEKSFLSIEISKCNKKENNNCIEDLILKKYIQNKKFKIMLIDSFPDYGNYQEPFSYYIKEHQFYINFNIFQEQDLFVSNLKIVNRSGFIYPTLSYRNTDHLLERTNSFVSEIDIDKPILLKINFRLGLFQQTFRRVYLKIQDLLGIIGGFTEIVFIALKLLCGFFNKYLLNQFIINSVVDFEDEKENLMKKRRDGLPKSNDGKVMSIADSIKQFQMINNSNPADKSKLLGKKQMSKLFKNKLELKDIDRSLNKISEEKKSNNSDSPRSSLPSPLNSNQLSNKHSQQKESNSHNSIQGQGSNRLKNGSNYEIIDNSIHENKDVRKSNESSKFNLNLNNLQTYNQNQNINNEGISNQTYREIDSKDILRNDINVKPLIGDISKRRGNSSYFDSSNRELKDIEEDSKIKEMNKSINVKEPIESNINKEIKKVEIKKDIQENEPKQEKFYISYFDVIGTNIFFCCSKYYNNKRETLLKYENVVLEYFDYETVIKEVISFKNYKKHLMEKEEEEQKKGTISNFFVNNEKNSDNIIIIPKQNDTRKKLIHVLSNDRNKSKSSNSNSHSQKSSNKSNKSNKSNRSNQSNHSIIHDNNSAIDYNNMIDNNKLRKKSLSINLNSINGSIKFNLDRFSLSGLHDPKISKSSKGSKMHKQIHFGHKITEVTHDFEEKDYDAKKLDESINNAKRKSKKNSYLNHLHSIKSIASNNTKNEVTEVSIYENEKISFQEEKVNKPNWWDLYNENIDEVFDNIQNQEKKNENQTQNKKN